MTDAEWSSITNFKASENFGDSTLMQYSFMHILDVYRSFLRREMRISCGTQGKHTTNSMHYLGCAVDVIIDYHENESLLDCYISALRFPFTGIGIYPHWMLNGKVIGGLHLEVGPDSDNIEDVEVKRLWLGIGTDATNTAYLPVTKQNIKNYLI